MSDLKDPRAIYAKGFLFLITGFVASALLMIELPSLKNLALLIIAIWSFCRFYYFAFYVIQHYVDSEFRFAGLWDFAKYVAGKKN
jgi:hypothetical protein